MRNMAVATIYSHLAKLMQEGKPIDFKTYVSDDEFEKIKAVLPQFEDTNTLKPIFEALNGEIDYGIIRMTLTFLEMGKN